MTQASLPAMLGFAPSVALRADGAAVVREGDVTCALTGRLDAPSRAAGESAAAHVAGVYAKRGVSALADLRGDFALLLWDAQRDEGLAMVDPIGTRPLYYAEAGGVLHLAPEVRDLLDMLPRRPAPDPVSMAHWLAISAPAADATLFAGVKRVPAGHRLRIAGGRSRLERWWWASPEPLRLSRDEAGEAVDAAVRAAVARRCAAGDAAIMLSGGLDSSALAGFAAADGLRPVAYSAVFPAHPAVDEERLIELTAAGTGLPSVRLAVAGGSVLAGALAHVERWALPPVSPNEFFWQPLLARAAADGARVVLDGEGGDELFGSAPYLLADRVRSGRLLDALRLARDAAERGAPLPWRRVGPFVRHFGIAGALPYRAHAVARRTRSLWPHGHPLLRRSAARLLLTSDAGFEWMRTTGPRWRARLLDAAVDGRGPVLAREYARRRAGGAGLESAHPLLDSDVVELVAALPPELAYDRRHSRPLLREAARGLIPEEVRSRPHKSYFDALFHQALAGADLPSVCRMLADRPEIAAYVDPAAVRRLLERVPGDSRAGLEAWALQVWRLVTAECWLRGQADAGWLARENERLQAPDVAFRSSVFPPCRSRAACGQLHG